MKRILLIITIIFALSCDDGTHTPQDMKRNREEWAQDYWDRNSVRITMDSCEWITDYGYNVLVHRTQCVFCAERKNKLYGDTTKK